ncbi:tetratricopeptide repeat protein [Amphiplicatus metriothermophilus]|uniref:Tetratricopeptide repeat-containing protein n=1 Tax=Amphiplicatus metriothermophilus TaxID=1519374 RepID=A0A239PLJ0_9PROT|nr:tetratricopeptide repeat protein [Amphiplicatus metriothermophilus]MBB5517244.1 tetratricopeptide (TPR) repeat protein [Amphiplicatus metriothermophilus]SNT68420.1 Tetratricopeptide repeat-containing protein [Amphiplicatus metriothermophilus]
MSETLTRELHRAAALFQAGDYAKALALCEAVLKAAPRNAEALHLKAMALGRLGRIEEAETIFHAVLKIHPRKAAVLSNLGNAMAAAGRHRDAISAYREATELEPHFANAWYNLASALMAEGDLAGAFDALTQVVRLQPDSAKARNNLGVVLRRLDRPQEAIEAFTAALRIDAHYTSALINRGKTLRERGDTEAALRDLRRAVAAAPKSAEAHYELANALRAAGDIDQARACYLRALSIAPDAVEIHADLARMLWEAGWKDRFLAVLDARLAQNPTLGLLALRADLAFRSGDIHGSEEAALRLLEQSAVALGAIRLARIRRMQERHEEAASLAEKALAAVPGDFLVRHEYAEALLAAGQATKAVETLACSPPRAHLQKHLALQALALRAAGDLSYRRLYDYDRFVATICIDPPSGYASVHEFNAALYEALKPLHRAAKTRPIDQTLYGGSQSFGRLWDQPDPAIQGLKRALLAAARKYVRQLPKDPTHPFLAAKTETLRCVGSWSVILESGGGHVDHIHPQGWVSASYYVQIPTEVSAAGTRAGCLRLGGSGVAGLNLPPERWFRPIPGTVVFFPSYIWHGVEPFTASEPRVTAPFDLAPA